MGYPRFLCYFVGIFLPTVHEGTWGLMGFIFLRKKTTTNPSTGKSTLFQSNVSPMKKEDLLC